MSDFSIIPYISFGIFLIFSLILLAYGEFLIKKGKAKEGFGLHIFSVKIFSTLLIIALTFYLLTVISWDRNIPTIKIPIITPEIPESPAINFPNPPEYIEVAGYYFKGPYIAREDISIPMEMIFSVFCKEEEIYKAIYTGIEKEEVLFGLHSDYQCFLENCKEKENLYIAFLYIEIEIEEIEEKTEVGKIDEKATTTTIGLSRKKDIVDYIERKEDVVCSVNETSFLK